MLSRNSTGKYSAQKFNDFGLGEKATADSYRSIGKNGSFNVKKINIPFFERLNFFHELVTMPWSRFFLIIVLVYNLVNILFATIYLLVGTQHLTGIVAGTTWENFMEAFFFSAQTITTLGYGRIAPIGLVSNIVAATESLLGLLSFAFVTGLIYGRFSKPLAKLKYSLYAVMAPYQDINGFMFRVVNPHKNQLMEAEVTAALSMRKVDSNLREFFTLELERSKVAFLPFTWTIVHPITEESPLFKFTKDELETRDVEFIIMMKAFDESFSQTVYSRTSYKANEIKWGEKFVYIINHETGKTVIDISRIDETEMAPLN